jgi:hypothetical protein
MIGAEPAGGWRVSLQSRLEPRNVGERPLAGTPTRSLHARGAGAPGDHFLVPVSVA